MDIEKKVWEVLCSEEDLNKRIRSPNYRRL